LSALSGGYGRQIALQQTTERAAAALRAPITGIAGCCACDANDHEAAALPRSPTNSRRPK
jgi:hypothetical protein